MSPGGDGLEGQSSQRIGRGDGDGLGPASWRGGQPSCRGWS
jgi:hypothetical protein